MDTKKLRQKILDLAIRGKLVPQNPNDEPASVLLERIRAEKERLIAEGKIKRPKKSKSSSSESHYQQLPDGWTSCTIDNLVKTVTDFVASGSFASLRENVKYFDSPNYAILVRTKDFQSNFTNGLVYTDKHGYEFLENSNLFGGELILPNIGASIGKAFIVPKLDYPMTLAPNSIMVKCWDEVTLTWLYYYFLSTFGQNALRNISGSTAQGKFNKTDFKGICIPVPPLNEQKKIVNQIISIETIINVITHNETILKGTIRSIKSKILDLAMQGKLVPQDSADEPAADMLLRINPKAKIITDNPHYPQLPNNWVCTCFTDVCSTALGKTLNKATDQGQLIDYLCAINVKDGYFDLSTIKQTKINPEEFERYSVYKGDLLVCEGGDVGRCAIWQGDRIFYQNALHRIRPLIGIEQKFLLYILLYSKNNHWIDDLCSGVTIKHFTTKAMSSLIIAMPPINEQKRIIEKIENLFELLNAIERALKIK